MGPGRDRTRDPWIILPILFVLKLCLVIMAAAHIFKCTWENTFTMGASTMNPDQTAPLGAV